MYGEGEKEPRKSVHSKQFTAHHSLINKTWKAMMMQLTAMTGDSRSPTRAAFQHRPYKPLCCAATETATPGPLLLSAELKMDG